MGRYNRRKLPHGERTPGTTSEGPDKTFTGPGASQPGAGAAQFREDLPSLWMHPGVSHEQREALVQEVFRKITIDGKEFVSIEPNPKYIPIFAAVVTGQKLGDCALKPPCLHQ